MKLASIQAVREIRPVHGADRIVLASVLGYQTIVRKNEFQPGDLCVWHEPDTVAGERPEYEFLRRDNFRLKVKKIRGEVSQGLALPLTIIGGLNGFKLGDDVTDLVGIRKYEKPPPRTKESSLPFPDWLVKTDEPNLRSYPEAVAEFMGRPCVITQKVDGASATFYRRAGAFGVCSRNIEVPQDDSPFWQVTRQFRLAEALASLSGDFAIQGEIYGKDIQGNHLGIECISFMAFSLLDIGTRRYLGHRELALFCQSTGVPMVKQVWTGHCQFELNSFVELANQQEYTRGSPAEGIVIRPVEETESKFLPGGRLSGKIMNEKYALTHGE